MDTTVRDYRQEVRRALTKTEETGRDNNWTLEVEKKTTQLGE